MMKRPLTLQHTKSIPGIPGTASAIAIIGLGNWGTSLAAGLSAAGIPICEVILRRIPSRKRSGLRRTTLDRAALDAPVLWLCVPDGAIATVAASLVERRRELGRGLDGQIVLHSSGVLTVEALARASEAGAQVGSVHPLMTFPTRRPVSLAGVPFAVESSPGLRRKLFALVRLLGGEPFRIDSPNKILYHAAAMLASPLLLSALVAAQQTAMLAGLSAKQAARLLSPLAASTLHNFVAGGPVASFSGPIARGDTATIQLHLRALAKHPILAGAYRALALNAIKHLPARGREEMVRAIAAASRVQSADG